jgi:hypothetical protein
MNRGGDIKANGRKYPRLGLVVIVHRRFWGPRQGRSRGQG